MRVVLERSSLLKSLNHVHRVVERRNTIPILSNVLLSADGANLSLKATDLDLEVTESIAAMVEQAGSTTVPAHLLYDIVRKLPDGSEVMLKLDEDGNAMTVIAGRSSFRLQCLPQSDFPQLSAGTFTHIFRIEAPALKALIDKTQFAISTEETRYYLNGIFLHTIGDQDLKLRAVATDGHRLALCSMSAPIEQEDRHQVIVPRKGILELARLLTDPEGMVSIVLGQHHIRATTGEFTFTSKLVDGKFPDYERVLPKGGDKLVVGDRQALREAFSRTAILSNEKYRGIRLQLAAGQLKIQANNPEQEEAEEEISVDYEGSSLEIGFNVSYLLDVLGVMTTEQVRLILSDSNSSALLQEAGNDDSSYVVMPMRL